MERGKCYLCKVEAGNMREQSCLAECVIKKDNQAEAARLRDFQTLKSDGVDYTDTDHPKPKHSSGISALGWADIVSGKCKCKQCEQARFAHTVKQMVAEEKKSAKEQGYKKQKLHGSHTFRKDGSCMCGAIKKFLAEDNFPHWQINI